MTISFKKTAIAHVSDFIVPRSVIVYCAPPIFRPILLINVEGNRCNSKVAMLILPSCTLTRLYRVWISNNPKAIPLGSNKICSEARIRVDDFVNGNGRRIRWTERGIATIIVDGLIELFML